MSTLSRILERATSLNSQQRDWLHQLTGDWQILADITFSDLVLYVDAETDPIVAAQARPATAATLNLTDFVGEPATPETAEHVHETARTCLQRFAETEGELLRFVPVNYQNKCIGVLEIITAKSVDRVPSQTVVNYEAIADALIGMVQRGEFPREKAPTGFRHGTPRVTDGLVHVDADGVTLYASPNAVSHFRRLGVERPLQGTVLAESVTEVIDTEVDEALPVVLTGKAAWVAEIEANGITISLRAVPLVENGERQGALILCRDVTELRRQERVLVTKDSTIREINHRVKNNLQTVSALLQMQARRVDSEDARAALHTAQRRVATIAVVHEKLSQTINEIVDFDSVFVPVMRMVRDVAVTDDPVVTTFDGAFGHVSAEQATALGIVMNEIISNAVEHGLPRGGRLAVSAKRDGGKLHIEVADDGVGIGESGPGSGLGTQIIHSMVAGELNGKISWHQREEGGTVVVLDLHVRSK